MLTMGCANTGVVSSFMTGGWKEKPSTHYKLDTHGYDARVYERESETNPNFTCISIATDSHGMTAPNCFKAK